MPEPPQQIQYYPREPIQHDGLDPATFNDLLRWAVEERHASDVKLIVGNPIWIKCGAAWHIVTTRSVRKEDIDVLLSSMYKMESASARVDKAEPLDFRHEFALDRFRRLRFRCNASRVRFAGYAAPGITLRTIPGVPPTMESLAVPAELIEGLFPQNGLVLVTGKVGTGKSTLLASIVRHIRETEQRSIATFEDPIEFDYSAIEHALGPVEQSEIPGDIASFYLAMRSATRRAFDVVVVGESHDPETLNIQLATAEQGVAVYTTVHTLGVSETPGRIAHAFPYNEWDSRLATLAGYLRCIVQQRLVPHADGGQIALREWLVFNEDMRRELENVGHVHVRARLEALVQEFGHPLVRDAAEHFALGDISEATYFHIASERGVYHSPRPRQAEALAEVSEPTASTTSNVASGETTALETTSTDPKTSMDPATDVKMQASSTKAGSHKASGTGATVARIFSSLSAHWPVADEETGSEAAKDKP